MKKTNPISIRPFTPKDYSAIQKIMEDGGVYYPNMDSRTQVLKKIRRNPGSILVAVIDKKVVGNIFIVEDGWVPLLFRLAVAKDARKQGVGTKLLETASEYLRKKGYPVVLFLVDNKKKKLLQFYKNRGFTIGSSFRWVFKELKK